MMNLKDNKNVISLESFTPTQDDNLFFDANIWLNLYAPTGDLGNQTKINIINSFYKRVLENSSKVFTCSLIISEFYNSYSRILFKAKQLEDPQKYKNYKRDFRNTQEFKKVVKSISSIVQSEILASCTKLDDAFSKIDLSYILSDNSYDFNDAYFCELCNKNNIKVVTADKDFLNLPLKNNLILI